MGHVHRDFPKKNKGAGAGPKTGQMHDQDAEVEETTEEELSQGEALDMAEDSMRYIADN